MWALDLWVAAAVVLSVVGAKWSSLRTSPLSAADAHAYWTVPVLSVPSWRKRRPAARGDVMRLVRDLALFGPPLVASWWLYLTYAKPSFPSAWLRGYLAIIPFYAFMQCASTLVELAYAAGGFRYPKHMRYPFLARSLDEFWGRRWGTWVADWMRQVVLSRYRRQPLVGMLAVFVVSGVWHEVLVDVPLHLFYGTNVLGWWVLYFLVQAAGMAVERRFLRTHPLVGAVFAWLVLLLPAPLALNPATLGVVGF